MAPEVTSMQNDDVIMNNVRSPVRSSVRSNVRSPVRSPVRSSVRYNVRFPVRYHVKNLTLDLAFSLYENKHVKENRNSVSTYYKHLLRAIVYVWFCSVFLGFFDNLP